MTNMYDERGLLVAPVGMSGAGKSHLQHKLSKDFDIDVVEPDAIRRELTGDVSDQSKNAEVFKQAYSKAWRLLRQSSSNVVYFDATNLSKKAVTQLMTECGAYGRTIVVFLTDSEDFELCRSRVRKDIKDCVDRSNVPDDVLERQQDRYFSFVSIANEIDGAVVLDDSDYKKLIQEIEYALRQDKAKV